MTDKVEKENVQIEYSPTNKIWGYFTTNKIQGTEFRNFRNYALGGNGKKFNRYLKGMARKIYT